MEFICDDNNVKVSGRSLFRENIRYLGYSGSSISFNFTGKKATAVIVSNEDQSDSNVHAVIAVFAYESDNLGVEHKKNKDMYYNNSYGKPVDLGGDNGEKRIVIDSPCKEYILYESDEEKNITLEIVKYSEPEYNACGIKKIKTDSESLGTKPSEKKHKMVIIGDSITCGFGTEGRPDDIVHRTIVENPYKAYAMTTARYFDADFEIMAWNGKGLLTGYIGEDTPAIKDQSWLISMLYEYTDAGLEKNFFGNQKSKWEKRDFSLFSPELVLFNLGTNDCSYTRGVKDRDEEYIKVYIDFLKRVHECYPDAKFLCMLGMMDQRLNDAVEEAVIRFKEIVKNDYAGWSENDIRFIRLPEQNVELDGVGTFYHPTPATQKKSADIIINEIKDFMLW